MPLIEKITNQNGTIGVWELIETADDLEQNGNLSPADMVRLKTLRFEKRRKEFLASRLLLQNLLPENPEIIYQEISGKPLLKGSRLNISITHSANLAAIILSEKKIGIDIEQLDRNIDKVVPRFVNSSEIQFIEKSKDPQLIKILLWTAKEAIFKCCGIQGIQFNKQINIVPFDYKTQTDLSGSLRYQGGVLNYDLFYRIIKNNVLVYCVQQ